MSQISPTPAQLCGQTESHLASEAYEGAAKLHRLVIPVVDELREKAQNQGMDLAIASGFRSFERQVQIWNAKAEGRRTVLDSQGQAMCFDGLSDKNKVMAILRWSALPGASRHHWGTDMDVWDKNAVPADYQLQLVTEEYGRAGPFYPLSQWLASADVESLGFYRPYLIDRGGIAPEPWHLSYRPLAEQFQQQLSLAILQRIISESAIALKQAVLDNLDEIFQRYVLLPG